jgi:ribose/xylose/arabinose/galactoside ABC-type transport system permease subunit
MALEDEEKGAGWKEAAAARVTSPAGTDLTAGIRRLPVWAFVVIAVVYLVIVQGVSKLLTAGMHTTYAAPTSVNELWRSITVPVLVSLVFVYAVAGVLGWWRPVFTTIGRSAAGCGSSQSSSPSPPWPG